MKKIGFALIALVLLAVALVPSPASAQISSYTADFQIVNLSQTNAATINIAFFAKNGTTVASVSDTIAANSSKTYSPLPNAVPSGFDGSVVISSNEPIAAITNVKSGDAKYGSSYSSFTGGSNKVSLPIINKAFYGINTWFNVQNTGSSATTVTVAYSGTSCTENQTIQPNAAATFNQATNTCLPNAYNGAATITAGSGGEIAAIALQVAGTGLFAYNGFADGNTTPVIPLVTSNVYGIHTGVQIQNQGVNPTNVTVSYTANPGTGTNCTESATIPAGGAQTFTINALSFDPQGTTSNCTKGQYWIGSARVTTNSTNQPLVAVVNQTNFTNKGGSSYGAFDPASASKTIVMPLLMNAYNIWTGFSVMNVGSADTVSCTYSGTAITVSKSLAANAAWDVQNVNGGTGGAGTLPPNYVGSGTCTAAGSGSLLGVVNQANLNVKPGTGDGTLTYEAVNK